MPKQTTLFTFALIFLLLSVFPLLSYAVNDSTTSGINDSTTSGINALQLGNKALLCKQPKQAENYYQQVVKSASSESDLLIFAQLNQARLLPDAQRLIQLKSLLSKVDKIESLENRARAFLNLAYQAQLLKAADLSYQAISNLEPQLQNHKPLLAELLDLKAQLYEDAKRFEESLILSQSGLDIATQLEPSQTDELLMRLHWRKARLMMQLKQNEQALAANLLAVQHLENIRQSMPIENEEGQSSYQSIIKPMYLELVSQLLTQALHNSSEKQFNYLNQSRQIIELLRQAEMQDFLGDRCSVESLKGDGTEILPAKTAVLYIVPMSDHIDLLMETSNRLVHQRVKVKRSVLDKTAQEFAEQTRNGFENYAKSAKKLYNWLIKPIDSEITKQQIDSLVIIPEGNLRLVAMGALHSGQQYLIERLAVTTTTGMSMTYRGENEKNKSWRSLVSGMSKAGNNVAEKLLSSGMDIFSAAPEEISRGLATQSKTLRAVKPKLRTVSSKEKAKQVEMVKEALALPGVEKEVASISKILEAVKLHNESFTLNAFSHETDKGDYQILHIASHGMFGGSAEDSFILTYDDLLTLNNLQTLLKAEQGKIDLLSLSACQTAEGNEKAPLGIAGAAMKARAKSVLGTLWPVEDEAARIFMEVFYNGFVKEGLTKAQAQRKAQLTLLKNPDQSHPFFWAPFVLVGNWQ